MPSIAILGASGAIGRNLAGEFGRREIPFAVVGRSREKLESHFQANRFASAAAADINSPQDLAAALAGAETCVYAVGVPYHEFRQHPVLMRAAVEACLASGVQRLIVVSSVYGYGRPQTVRVAEDHPRAPSAFKGRMRKEQEDIALAAHATGRLRTMVLRLPDFYGPFADLSITAPVFNAAFRNMAAPWIGPVDVPHEFIYVPDTAPVLADVAGRDDLYGRSWNLGGAGTITPREFVERVYAVTGGKPRIRNAGKFVLRVAGAFSKLMRELGEMYYLQETPVILDDSALAAQMSIRKTPYQEGIEATVAWARSRQA